MTSVSPTDQRRSTADPPEPAFTSLAGARALVTGGAGFIGSAIVDALVDAGADTVTVIDDLSRGRREHLDAAFERGRVDLVVGDLTDQGLVDELVTGQDLVFHQAALRITRCANEPRRAFEVMAGATFDLFEAAARHRVDRVVFASSASVYGQAEWFPTTEDHAPYADRTLYGATKAFGEGLLRSATDMWGLDGVALRYFNVYGPRMDLDGVYTEVLVRWMNRLAQGQAPEIHGDGSQTLDLVEVSDVARAALTAAVAPAERISPIRAYNVATGIETSLAELASRLGSIMGHDIDPIFGPERRVNGLRRRQGGIDAAARDLGFTARVELDEGLARLVDWWREASREPQPQSGSHDLMSSPASPALSAPTSTWSAP